MKGKSHKKTERAEELKENLYSKVKHYYPDECDKIFHAYEVAEKAHEGQFRASGSEYITHPIQVADILIDLGLDYVTVCAALLHDTVEDTSVTDEQLRSDFGEEIANLVQGVTKLAKIQFNTIEEEQAENIRKMFFAMSKDIRVLIIKLADRLHNMRSLSYLSEDRQQMMANETMEIYAPLAGRLGISQIKCELEDLCLKYIDPEAYDYLAKHIALTRTQRQEQVEQFMLEIKELIKDAEVENAEVSGRTKHFYSIYKKMKYQNKTLDQIYDLTAVRVIVESVKDCFSVLGVLHARWKPIPGRFKDYIAMPKPNMYQSLHTTVVTNYGAPFEIQIRTYEMHKIAEYGIAAHWKYKEGIKGVTNLDDKLKWVQEVISYSPEIQDSREYLDLIKRDISVSNEIYVFTPKGDVRALSANATALDFAYAIHSEVGNHCVGVRVNGRIVNIERPLVTGDVIEVMTNPNSKGPSRDWLKIVKTSTAKAKIRQFFKRELKEEHIKTGKNSLEREAKRRGITLAQLLTPEGINAVFERYSFDSLDEVYASVGYGGITANQIITKLASSAPIPIIAPPPVAEKPEYTHTKSGKDNLVIVQGRDDLAIRFSACCSPLPGDDIIGYISRGRGVTIHRADCYSIKGFEAERLVTATWKKTSENPMFSATVQVISEDKGDVFGDITKIIMGENLTLLAINARKDRNHNAIATISVEVKDNDQVQQLIGKFLNLSTTIKAYRITK